MCESATFSGIPLVEHLKEAKERTCGVWVLKVETGETLGFCHFEKGVQAIFAEEALPGVRFPDLDHDAELVGGSYVLGDDALTQDPKALRA